MSINVTESESPGSAPLTAIGPVALLTRFKSSWAIVSFSLCTWPVKQSHVSISMTVPGSTVTTGCIAESNAHTCWSLLIFTVGVVIVLFLFSCVRADYSGK